MAETGKPYLPAAGHDWALPLYDPLVKLLGIESTRDELIAEAGLEPGRRVLEIGCGTGSLIVAVKRHCPTCTAVGLDPDPKALALARRKSEAARLEIQLDRGYSDEMPYPDASFDRVLSSFMFHHLSQDAKTRTLSEVRRVLEPGGTLHLLDFAESHPRGRGFLMRIFHADSELAENAEDRVIERMRAAGFQSAERIRQQTMFFGHLRLNYYRAVAATT